MPTTCAHAAWTPPARQHSAGWRSAGGAASTTGRTDRRFRVCATGSPTWTHTLEKYPSLLRHAQSGASCNARRDVVVLGSSGPRSCGSAPCSPVKSRLPGSGSGMTEPGNIRHGYARFDPVVTCRPLYCPHLGQTQWGGIFAPQSWFGHRVRAGGVAFHCARWLRTRERDFLRNIELDMRYLESVAGWQADHGANQGSRASARQTREGALASARVCAKTGPAASHESSDHS